MKSGKATALAQEFGTTMSEEWLPLQMIGSEPICQAVEKRLARLEKLTGLGRVKYATGDHGRSG